MSVLKIDRDCIVSPKWHRDWKRCTVQPVCKYFNFTIRSMKAIPSTRKGVHIEIHVSRKLRPNTINEVQYILGDDAVRVSMNRARIRAGLREWNKLWVTPNMNPYATRISRKARLLNWFNTVLRRTKPKHKR